ncbi:MAG: hypothetical protein LBK99_10350 [Opitutaceae bacterium]|nr:hypothetical protein [Opitutaceae bacterium]
MLGAEAIRQTTGGKMDLLAEPHARRVASFARDWQIVNNLYPAFGDVAIWNRPSRWLTDFVAMPMHSGAGRPRGAGLKREPNLGGQLYSILFGLSHVPDRPSGKPHPLPEIRIV